jgi:hypothetical protein
MWFLRDCVVSLKFMQKVRTSTSDITARKVKHDSVRIDDHELVSAYVVTSKAVWHCVEIWSECDGYCILTVQSNRSPVTFRRNVLPSLSRSMSNSYKKLTGIRALFAACFLFGSHFNHDCGDRTFPRNTDRLLPDYVSLLPTIKHYSKKA